MMMTTRWRHRKKQRQQEKQQPTLTPSSSSPERTLSAVLEQTLALLNSSGIGEHANEEWRRLISSSHFELLVARTTATKTTNNKPSARFSAAAAVCRHWDICLLALVIVVCAAYLVSFTIVYASGDRRVEAEFNRALLDSFDWSMRHAKRIFLLLFRVQEEDDECLVSMPDSLASVLRRPVDDCSMCASLHAIERIERIDKRLFVDKYAYSGRPVVIAGAIDHWPALHTLSFEFLKELYTNLSSSARHSAPPKQPTTTSKYTGSMISSFVASSGGGSNSNKNKSEKKAAERLAKSTCQFFSYKSGKELKSLDDVFTLRTSASWSKPWYVGWSNCNNEASKVLRSLYDRPYFLPDEAEMSRLDWLFMGTPGYGATMHLDDVKHQSWQAQLSGVKRWQFRPPIECLVGACAHLGDLYVDVHPGEVIVFDSNCWYHATRIVGDQLSLTIGSEYD